MLLFHNDEAKTVYYYTLTSFYISIVHFRTRIKFPIIMDSTGM